MTVTVVPDGSLLLDVREHGEWAAGHVADAVHLPLGELEARVGELPRDREIICTCRAGGRAGRAAVFLAGQGLRTSVYEGGMLAWEALGLPMVSSDGAPPCVI